MAKCSEVFVGIDTAKTRHAIAVADAGRDGEVRYLGEIDSAPATVERVIKSWAAGTRKSMFVTKLDRLDTVFTGRCER